MFLSNFKPFFKYILITLTAVFLKMPFRDII